MQSFGIIASVITILLAGSMHIFHDSINVYLMGFFRDLARIKARKRRMNNSMAISNKNGLTKKDLKMLLFKKEEKDPLDDLEIYLDIDADGNVKVTQSDANNGSTKSALDSDLTEYTREELYEFGNGDNDAGTLLLSLYGRVYDVSEGWKYYGEGGKYHNFAGRDVTRALSTGCMSVSCLGPKKTSPIGDYSGDSFEFTPKIVEEGKKWVSFFETHDSYQLVGILKDSQPIDALVDQQLEIDEALRDQIEER